jgi:hypothetical protein
MTEHIHHYDWIVSWESNSEGNLVFSIGEIGSDMHAKSYFYDVPDVQTGIKQCELAIDRFRDKRYWLMNECWDELRDTLRELKYPPPKYKAPTPDYDDPVPF